MLEDPCVCWPAVMASLPCSRQTPSDTSERMGKPKTYIIVGVVFGPSIIFRAGFRLFGLPCLLQFELCFNF